MGGVIGVNKHRKGQFVERSGSGNHLSESCVTQSGNSGENRKRRHWEHAIFGGLKALQKRSLAAE